jgi:putative ABC transport system permease protein
LRVLTAALIIAVASVAAVGFFTDRIQLAMEHKSGELLGADLVIVSPDPVSVALFREADARSLQTATTQSFRSVVLNGEETYLAEVKAVSSDYPLRGSLQVSEQPFALAQETRAIPSVGHVWLDERLLQALKLKVGERLELGASKLVVEKVLAYEPDRGGDLFSIAPRLLMNLADVPATALVQPGSRVQYRLLVAGDPAAIEDYRTWAQTHLDPGEQLQGVRDARPELRAALERAQRFLGLAAVISVILAGVAIAMAVRRFVTRHWDSVAIMRCVGATQATVLRLYLFEMLALALLAGSLGIIVGYFTQYGLSRVLIDLGGGGELPPPSWRPLVPALTTGFIALLGFGLPPLIRLRHVSPLRVLRRDLGPLQQRTVVLYGPASIAVAILLLWQAKDSVLALYVFAGVLVTLLVLGVTAWGLVKGLSLLRGRVGVAWRFGLANISRRGISSVVQVVALGVGIMVLLVLSLVRNDLLVSWQASLPADAPNHFLINIQTEEVPGVRDFLIRRGLDNTALFPMVRGRLMAINGHPVRPENYKDDRAQRLVEREFNLSWAENLQADNHIVAGRWWQKGDHGQRLISVEQGLAKELGIALHATLSFQVAGQSLEARVTSLRSVEWDSFRVNFFVLFPPGVIEDYPATWITSFHITKPQKPLLTELVRTYPAVTVLDVEAILSKVREIIERVIVAVEYVFLFTLLAGLAVLYAAIQTTQDERRFESAILRTLGAGKNIVFKSLLAEFATLGLLAGLLAALVATLLGYVLAEHVFEFPYKPNALLWLIGTGAGLLGVSIAGLVGTRSVIGQPPLRSLREG